MKATSAMEGGLLGAFALSVMHQILKAKSSDAPHMDDLGMEALTKTLNFAGLPIPDEKKLLLTTLAGDIFANTAFFSTVGAGGKNNIWLRGILMGLSAGIGGVLLPKPMGLNEQASNRTTATKIMTMGLYLLGGIVASAVMDHLQNKEQKQSS